MHNRPSRFGVPGACMRVHTLTHMTHIVGLLWIDGWSSDCVPRALQVLGNCKGVIAAAVSVALFRNPVTAKGCAGYAVTIVGVFCYSEVSLGGLSWCQGLWLVWLT